MCYVSPENLKPYTETEKDNRKGTNVHVDIEKVEDKKRFEIMAFYTVYTVHNDVILTNGNSMITTVV